jgi:lipid-binding SYLF domain-containing protein
MVKWTRRNFVLASSTIPLISCAQISSSISPLLKPKSQISSEIRYAKNIMNTEVPGSIDLEKEAKGLLIIPKVTEASFWLGGAYGEGGLLIGDAIVGYFNMAQASVGLKIGLQDYTHALFFMNSNSLTKFRSSEGWSLGVDAEYVLAKDSGWIGRDVSTSKPSADIIALVFDRSGIAFGGSLEGVKYTPIYKN